LGNLEERGWIFLTLEVFSPSVKHANDNNASNGTPTMTLANVLCLLVTLAIVVARVATADNFRLLLVTLRSV